MPDEEETRSEGIDKSGWKRVIEVDKNGLQKVVEPVEKKGGHAGVDFSDMTAPTDKPGVIEAPQNSTPDQPDSSEHTD